MPTSAQERKDEYYRRLLAGDSTTAAQLKQELLAETTHLYRYRLLSGYGLEELVTGQVFMAKPAQFNDPYECKRLLPPNAGPEALRSAYAALVHFSSLDVRIASLSENPRSILMWAHYANRPQGYCVEYSTADLIQDEQIARGLTPAIYQDSLFAPQEILNELPPERLKAILLQQTCCKLSSWKYEREWRLIHLQVSEPTDPDSQWPGPLAPRSRWAPKFDCQEQSQIVGEAKGAGHFVSFPKPSRVILFGDTIDDTLLRLIRGISRLDGVPLARAELTPDAAPDAELEIIDAG